jgi:hypothetical protein
MSRPRRPVWKILLGILAFLVAVTGATFLWIDRVADRRWKELGERLEILKREVEARDGRRPVLRGVPEPGNAWKDYIRAFEAYRRPVGKLPSLHDLDQVPPACEVETVTDHLKANEAVLEQIRSGTRRANGDFPMRWEEGERCKLRGYLGDEVLSLFRFHVRQLIRENRDSEASAVLLDYLQFVRDRANWPASSGSFSILSSAVAEDLRIIIVSRPLSAKELLQT